MSAKSIGRLAILIAATACLASPVHADGPEGIGFAQAEEGTWWCRGGDAAAALECARQKCSGESGGQECFPTRWCYPAGWSGLMVVWLPEFHSTHVVCGMPGEEAARAALKAICQSAPEFTSCDLALLIDYDGKEMPLDETVDPRAGAAD